MEAVSRGCTKRGHLERQERAFVTGTENEQRHSEHNKFKEVKC